MRRWLIIGTPSIFITILVLWAMNLLSHPAAPILVIANWLMVSFMYWWLDRPMGSERKYEYFTDLDMQKQIEYHRKLGRSRVVDYLERELTRRGEVTEVHEK